jgi:hypothetical protein
LQPRRGQRPLRSRLTPIRSKCALGQSGAVKHVVFIQFDNTHLSRDNANVPSDIEQMPAL